MRSKFIYMILFWVTAMLPDIKAQESQTTSLDDYMEVELRVALFHDELSSLYQLSKSRLNVDYDKPMNKSLVHSLEDRLSASESTLQLFANKWNTFSQYQLTITALSEEILEQVATIQQMQQEITDSLQVRRQLLDNILSFSKAEAFIFGKDSTYRQLYNKAMPLSFAQQSAPLLEKLKASEQLLFAQIEEQYAQAQTIATAIPRLSKRMEGIENKFIELKTVSGKIQEAAYKPLFERLKDYLMGFAAVAILLMFGNMVMARVNSFIKLQKQAKEIKNKLRGNGDFYPTI